MEKVIPLTVLWCIVLNLHCDCLASKFSKNVYRAREANGDFNVLASLKSTNGILHRPDHKKRRNNETEESTLASESNVNLADGSDFARTRTLNSAKLKNVCRLLKKALDGLKECDQSTSVPGKPVLKLKDKSSKPKPSLCCIPCGCGGCCLMRPMIMYKVKYSPPKFKMKPLKSKTKCGCPHYGVYLGRKRR